MVDGYNRCVIMVLPINRRTYLMSIKTTITKIHRSQIAYDHAKMLAIAGGVKQSWFDKVEQRQKSDYTAFKFLAGLAVFSLTVAAIILENYLEANGLSGFVARMQMGIPVQIWGLVVWIGMIAVFGLITLRGVAGTPFEYLAETEIALLNDSIIAGAEAHNVAPIVLSNERVLGMRLLKQLAK